MCSKYSENVHFRKLTNFDLKQASFTAGSHPVFYISMCEIDLVVAQNFFLVAFVRQFAFVIVVSLQNSFNLYRS